jgi:hypothetical protein
VVPFLGACLQPPDNFWLLSEFMPGGTLAAWIKGKGPNTAGTSTTRSLAARAQAGLEVRCCPASFHRVNEVRTSHCSSTSQ